MTSTTLQRSELSADLAGWSSGDMRNLDKPRLILIHGVGLRAEAWNPMLPELTRKFSVCAIDLPGHGHSPALDVVGDARLGDFSHPVAEMLNGFGGKCIIVGHSLGALIAMDLAINYPHLVSAVIPLNAVFQRSEAAKQAVKARVAELSKSDTADPTTTLERWFGTQPSGDLGAMADDCRDWLSSVDPSGYRTAYTVFANEDGPEENDLRSLACPALFMTGSQEPNSTEEMSRNMADLVATGATGAVAAVAAVAAGAAGAAGAEVVIIEGARHMMPMTHARQVSFEICRFCQDLDGRHA